MSLKKNPLAIWASIMIGFITVAGCLNLNNLYEIIIVGIVGACLTIAFAVISFLDT